MPKAVSEHLHDGTISKAGAWARHIFSIAIVVIPFLTGTWFLLREPARANLGITEIEKAMKEQSEKAERIDFVAVVVICRSGDYTVDEIKRIKMLYRLGRLDVDSLVADWYEK